MDPAGHRHQRCSARWPGSGAARSHGHVRRCAHAGTVGAHAGPGQPRYEQGALGMSTGLYYSRPAATPPPRRSASAKRPGFRCISRTSKRWARTCGARARRWFGWCAPLAAEGIQVTADQYPYTASGSSVGASPAAPPGRRWAATPRCSNASTIRNSRPRLVAEMKQNLERRGGADSLLIVSSRDRQLIGQDARSDRKRPQRIAHRRGARNH